MRLSYPFFRALLFSERRPGLSGDPAADAGHRHPDGEPKGPKPLVAHCSPEICFVLATVDLERVDLRSRISIDRPLGRPKLGLLTRDSYCENRKRHFSRGACCHDSPRAYQPFRETCRLSGSGAISQPLCLHLLAQGGSQQQTPLELPGALLAVDPSTKWGHSFAEQDDPQHGEGDAGDDWHEPTRHTQHEAADSTQRKQIMGCSPRGSPSRSGMLTPSVTLVGRWSLLLMEKVLAGGRDLLSRRPAPADSRPTVGPTHPIMEIHPLPS